MIGSSSSLRSERVNALPASPRETSGLVDQLRKILRNRQRLVERIEALADSIDLSLVAGEVEQSGRITPC